MLFVIFWKKNSSYKRNNKALLISNEIAILVFQLHAVSILEVINYINKEALLILSLTTNNKYIKYLRVQIFLKIHFRVMDFVWFVLMKY